MQTQLSEQAALDGYELFRRAIVEHDAQAWAEGAARYRPLLIAWAARQSASASVTERCGDLADLAFARAWSALAPGVFARFPTLAALLAYLRTCVTSAVIDCARSAAHYERGAQALSADDMPTPEQIVLDAIDRDQLWQIASRTARSERERVVLSESFVYDLPPRAILARHPDLFAHAGEIYAIRRNLLDRLKRCPEMRRLYRERIDIEL